MDLRFVYTFYRAAMLSSITAAAEELRIVPGAAARRIRELENDLNTELLDRRPDKRFRLTPAGTRFLLDAKRLLDLWNQVQTGIGKSSAFARPLRLGAMESVLHSWLIPWIEALRTQQPELQLELTVETTAALLDLMRRGTLDVAFASLPLHADGVRTRELQPMPMVFAGRPTPSSKRKYTLEQLAEREFLTFQRNSQPHLVLLERLRAAGLDGTRVHAISSISAMMRLAAGGFGVATLPKWTLDQFGSVAGVDVLRCDVELDPLPVHVSWVQDPGSTALDAIVEHAITASARSDSRA
jgi:DNA-binding transcriptional LysR family regulator